MYICTMRRYAPLQYQQVLLRAPTASLYYISSPTTASTFALACCDDFCQRRAKLYLTYCKRAFGKPQRGKSAQQARANAYFFRRSVACIAIPRQDPLHKLTHFGTLLGARPVLGAHFTRNPSGGCFDCAYGFAQHDIIYERHFFGASANEKTATGDKLSLSPLAVDVNVCSCKIRVSKTCAYLCACKHTCAVVCNKCSSHCFSPQSIAKQYKRIV